MTKKMHTFTSTRNTAIGKQKLTWRHLDERDKDYKEQNPQHFFGSSFMTYIVDEDFSRIYDALVKEGNPFSIWLIKQDKAIDYKIVNWCPQIDDDKLEYIGTWYMKEIFPEKFEK